MKKKWFHRFCPRFGVFCDLVSGTKKELLSGKKSAYPGVSIRMAITLILIIFVYFARVKGLRE